MTESLLFLVHCQDAPDAVERRAAAVQEHRRYIEQNRERIYLGGPLVDDSRSVRIGSVLVLKAASHEEARAFMDAEPYNVNGVFESVVIRAFECVVRPDNDASRSSND